MSRFSKELLHDYLVKARESALSFWGTVAQPMPASAENFADQVLESDKEDQRFGYIVFATVFIGFGAWSALAPLESAALARGTVQVEGDRKPVQHLDGGIVAEVYVSNGDYVSGAAPLLQLDDTQLAAQRQIIQGREWAKRAAVARLESERDGLAEILFPEVIAALQDPRVQIAMANEVALFDARRADLLGELSVAEKRIDQLREQIVGTEAVLSAEESVAASLRAEVTDLSQLLEEGFVDKQGIRRLERELAQSLGRVSDLKASIAAARVAIQEAQVTMLQINKRFITQVVDALKRAQEELYDLNSQYDAITAKVERSTIRSPSSGHVLAFQASSVGAVVLGGQEIMSIVPDSGELIVTAKLSPMDIDRIRVGQEAEIRFAVFKDAYTITGVLRNVSADALIDETNGQSYFEAKVGLLESDLALLGEEKLVPGMPADVLIKTGRRTLLGYLTSPLHRMFEQSLIEG